LQIADWVSVSTGTGAGGAIIGIGATVAIIGIDAIVGAKHLPS
jgi:hypothetical protein